MSSMVQACDMLGGPSEVASIDFSAYTAGTGNAGTTILSATVMALLECPSLAIGKILLCSAGY